MAESPHIADADNDVQVDVVNAIQEASTTVQVEARRPLAAKRVEQELRSVVIGDVANVPAQYDPADVTETIRPRARARSTSARLTAWIEGHWVWLAITVSVPLALLLGWRLFR